MRKSRRVVTAAGVAVLVVAVAGQEPHRYATATGSWPVSAAVLATFIIRGESVEPAISPAVPSNHLSGPLTLELLVLWRGAPGWFAQGTGKSESGGGDSNGHYWVHLQEGSIDLDLDLNMDKRIATIGGSDTALGEANVLLVDGVGSAGVPTVHATASVPSAVEAPPGGLYAALRAVPNVLSFLQCESRLPDPGDRLGVPAADRLRMLAFMQQVLDDSCARVAGK